ESLIETVQMIQEQLRKRAVDKLYVVNNAGVVEPIQRATKIELEDWYEHYQVNVFSPIYILSTLIKDAEDVEVYGVNITSGAAESNIRMECLRQFESKFKYVYENISFRTGSYRRQT